MWSVLSFFATGICVQSLSFTAFYAGGIRVRLFVFALLALVSGYQCTSQFLVSCCALAAYKLHPWGFELEFFPSRYAVDSSTNSALKQTPFGISPQSLRNCAQQSAHYTNGHDRGAASKSARLNCTDLTHFHLTAGRFCGNSCIVMLWVACELLQFAAIQ